jgi:hypothetical protein
MASEQPTTTPIGKMRSPWAVWWLSGLTVGVYYLIWYVRVNKELARAAGADIAVSTFGLWASQCLPVVCWVSLAHTARRLGAAQQHAGMTPTVSSLTAVTSSLWFGSHTRYLQRRANRLWQHLAAQQYLAGVQAALQIHEVYSLDAHLDTDPRHAAS